MVSRCISHEQRFRTGGASWIAPTVFVCLVIGHAGSAAASGQCQKAAQHVARSCQDAAKSDFVLALAYCDNLSDPAARPGCRAQAEADQKDALDACDESLAAREEECD